MKLSRNIYYITRLVGHAGCIDEESTVSPLNDDLLYYHHMEIMEFVVDLLSLFIIRVNNIFIHSVVRRGFSGAHLWPNKVYPHTSCNHKMP
jgi:hypothetical protein